MLKYMIFYSVILVNIMVVNVRLIIDFIVKPILINEKIL